VLIADSAVAWNNWNLKNNQQCLPLLDHYHTHFPSSEQKLLGKNFSTQLHTSFRSMRVLYYSNTLCSCKALKGRGINCSLHDCCTEYGRLSIYFIFILLARESDGGAMYWINPQPLRSCSFPSFPAVS